MPVLFGNTSGRVVAITVSRGLPGALRVGGLDQGIFYRTSPLVVTTMRLNERVNAQFQPTLQRNIYVYAFGDAIGQLSLGGIAFVQDCNTNDLFVGLDVLRRFYHNRNISRSLQFVNVAIGTQSFDAMLVGIDVSASSPEQNLLQFNMDFAIPPRELRS